MSTAIVIFGASGDLTSRKLIPALYNNHRKKRLPEKTIIIGVSRSSWTDDAFRGDMLQALKEFAPADFEETTWQSFAPMLFYLAGDLENAALYQALAKKIDDLCGPS